MAKHKYRVASDEGAFWTGQELDSVIELELDADTERAVVAAGWLEKQGKKEKEG